MAESTAIPQPRDGGLQACATAGLRYPHAMKLLLAILAYLFIGVVLGAGILLMTKGSPWLLIISFVAYVIAFGKLGCLPKGSH